MVSTLDLSVAQLSKLDRLATISWAMAYPHRDTNFMTEGETDRVREAYGPNYDRLVEIKTRYDPESVFNFNQDIKYRLLKGSK